MSVEDDALVQGIRELTSIEFIEFDSSDEWNDYPPEISDAILKIDSALRFHRKSIKHTDKYFRTIVSSINGDTLINKQLTEPNIGLKGSRLLLKYEDGVVGEGGLVTTKRFNFYNPFLLFEGDKVRIYIREEQGKPLGYLYHNEIFICNVIPPSAESLENKDWKISVEQLLESFNVQILRAI